MRLCKYLFIMIVTFAVSSITCTAESWDAVKDFGPLNPNGAWSYGYGSIGTSFTPYTIYDPDCGAFADVPGLVCWTANTFLNTPGVEFNTTGDWVNYWTAVIPADVLNIHPGHDNEDPDSIVQWMAPFCWIVPPLRVLRNSRYQSNGCHWVGVQKWHVTLQWRTSRSTRSTSRSGRWAGGFLFRKSLLERWRYHFIRS